MIQFPATWRSLEMINPNGRINPRKFTRFMVALFVLAWATQLLLHQWGYGAELPKEAFVPADPAAHGATLELKSEATIVGAEVKLKQICRWSDADNAAMSPLAELTVA